jgi:hypothetical protein
MTGVPVAGLVYRTTSQIAMIVTERLRYVTNSGKQLSTAALELEAMYARMDSDKAALAALAADAVANGDLPYAVAIAPAWMASSIGERMTGKVLAIDPSEWRGSPDDAPMPYPILTVLFNTPEGVESVRKIHAVPKTLREQCKERDVQVGSVIDLAWCGTREAKDSGRQYHLYAFVNDLSAAKRYEW